MNIPRPEHPRPDFYRKEWINLNGEWEFEIDNSRSGEARGYTHNHSLSQTIIVPFCPESPLSGIGNLDFMDCVWYRKLINLPESWNGKKILLHFGAVDYEAKVWVNGNLVGSHRGGYIQFSFDITTALVQGENEIVLCATDLVRSEKQPGGKQSALYHSHGCMYRRTTGIWQTVWLEAVGDSWINRFNILPDLETGDVVIQAEIEGPSAELMIQIMEQGQTVAEKTVPACWRSTLAVLQIPHPHVWCPKDPFLYDLKLTLRKNGDIKDQVDSYFGFRKVHLEGNRFYLNNKILFQRLVLDQGFYPDGIYTAPTEEDLKKDIEISMAMGFDGARLHQKVFEPRFLYWADRLGYLVWDEGPNWGMDHLSYEAFENFTQEWIEVVQRDRNHPAIIGWCPLNETPNVQLRNCVELLYHLTRAIDPTRPIVDASGYTHVLTDVDDNHDYLQNPEEFEKNQAPLLEGKPFHNHPNDAPYRGQPFFCSEYGGIWWNPGQKDKEGWGYGDRPTSEEEFLKRLEGLTQVLLKNKGMCGYCYTQLTDVEQEVNGLLTFDRRPKFDIGILRQIFAAKAAIEE